MSKPSRKGPWWAISISFLVSCQAFVDAFIDREEDAIDALRVLPIFLAFFALSCWWMVRRLKALDRWKDERFWFWIMKDLPEED